MIVLSCRNINEYAADIKAERKCVKILYLLYVILKFEERKTP